MDIMVVVALLAPALPFLMKLGEKAAESAAEDLGRKRKRYGLNYVLKLKLNL